MSLPLLHTPADVLRWALVGLGAGADPNVVDGSGNPTGSWPLYVSSEPNLPDDVLTLFNTSPRQDGRSMIDGEVWAHWGVQLRIRGTDPRTLGTKAHSLYNLLNEGLYYHNVVIDGTPYVVYSASGVGLQDLGKDTPNSKRSLYTLNALITLRRVA